MSYPVYSVNGYDEKADFYVLIPVKMQEVVLEKKKRTEDFICTAVKRLRKQDREMPRGVIAEKLMQSGELIDTILDRVNEEESDSENDHSDRYATIREVRYVVFNQVTGLILHKLLFAKDMKEVTLTSGDGRAKFEVRSMNFDAFVLHRSLFASNDLTDGNGNINANVKRQFTEVEPDVESEDFGYLVSDIYPNSRPRDAYILAGITWMRFSVGNNERIKEDAWEIQSLSGGNRVDYGMREKLLSGTNVEYKAFQAVLGERFKNLTQNPKFKVKIAIDNGLLDAMNAKWSLDFDADLRQLIHERQEAVSGGRSGVIQKVYGVIEREFLALLNKETKTQKNKIRSAVKDMQSTWQISVKKLFDYAGLTYNDEYFGYFATVTSNKIHNMLFEERQAEFATAFIALLVKQSFTGNYEPIKRLASEYPDFIVEFDNLDLRGRRNKDKHKGQESEAEGAIRLAGKLEKALFGINLIEGLGFYQSEQKDVDSIEIAAIAATIRIPNDTELYERFAKAYSSFLLSDSKFYPDCENFLVELYNEGIRDKSYSHETDQGKRNERVVKYLSGAGYDHNELMNLTLLRSRTVSSGKRLLAQAFLDLLVYSGEGDRRFIQLLSEKKHILRRVNQLYEAIAHNGKPFEREQCAQFLELIEEQSFDLSQINGGT